MRCDLYARKSTADAGKSADRQERDWRADCADGGLEPGQVFVDPDLSASRYSKKIRPDYLRLVEHIKSGNCQMIGMWEASRGSRKLAEWVAFIDLCQETGTLIRVFGDGGDTFDPRKARDYKALADEGVSAHHEADRLSGRVLTGTRDAAGEGRPPGPLLFGYRRNYSRATRKGKSVIIAEQVIDPERSAVVRQMVADTLAGIPLNTQARRLNEAGVPTPSGQGRWVGAQINRLLRNPGLAGHRVHKGEVTKRNAWPDIVTDDEHRQLVALLDTPGRRGQRRNHANVDLTHQLSGEALCGVCGHPLRTERRTRYVCKQRGCGKVSARIDEMDQVVDRMIIRWLRRNDAAGVFAPEVDDAAVQAARRELRELREYLDEFYDDAPDKRVSAAAVARVEARTLPQIEALEARIRKLTTPPALQALAGVDVAGSWTTLPVGTRREVIHHLAEVRLSPVGRAGRWSPWRLADSRFRGDAMTWGEHWGEAGVLTENG